MASRFLTPLRGSGDPLLGIYREMNRMFDDVFSGSLGTAGGPHGLMATPSLDVHEEGDALYVNVELPGVRGEDVDVRLERDVLTISGEKKSEQDRKRSNVHVMERSYGRFSRSMQLPFMPDPAQVSADFENGVLRIRLQRNAQQQTSQRIQVRSGASQDRQLGQGGAESLHASGGSSSGIASGVGQGQGERSGSASGNGGSFAGNGNPGQDGAGQGSASSGAGA